VENAAAVLTSPRHVTTERRPVPTVGPHEVLVRVEAVGVCGSDIHYYEHGRIGDFVVRAPLVLGHEAAGVIEAVGAEVDSSRIGERVSLEPGIPDGVCDQCRAGRYNLCPNVRFFATPPVDGAFARLVAIEDAFAHPVPDSLSLDEAALMEPLSVGIAACRKARVSPGSDVLVTGAGPIGILAAQTARAFGASVVAITDVNADRLSFAAQFVDRAIDVGEERASARGEEYDVLIECSGSPAAFEDGIAAVRPAAAVVSVGMFPDGDIAFPIGMVQTKEIVLHGVFRYAHTYTAAIALAAAGRVDVGTLITSRHGLDEVAAALRRPREDTKAIKPLVLPQHGALG
jgi:L-iditol 2-dehydrogenase